MAVDAPTHVSRGSRVLHRWLAAQTFDLRNLDLAGFRRWLDGQFARREGDPLFQQRVRIRGLRRGHPELRRSEEDVRRAAERDAATPAFARLRQLDRDLAATARAVAGLTAALGPAAAERRPALEQKL